MSLGWAVEAEALGRTASSLGRRLPADQRPHQWLGDPMAQGVQPGTPSSSGPCPPLDPSLLPCPSLNRSPNLTVSSVGLGSRKEPEPSTTGPLLHLQSVSFPHGTAPPARSPKHNPRCTCRCFFSSRCPGCEQQGRGIGAGLCRAGLPSRRSGVLEVPPPDESWEE